MFRHHLERHDQRLPALQHRLDGHRVCDTISYNSGLLRTHCCGSSRKNQRQPSAEAAVFETGRDSVDTVLRLFHPLPRVSKFKSEHQDFETRWHLPRQLPRHLHCASGGQMPGLSEQRNKPAYLYSRK